MSIFRVQLCQCNLTFIIRDLTEMFMRSSKKLCITHTGTEICAVKNKSSSFLFFYCSGLTYSYPSVSNSIS